MTEPRVTDATRTGTGLTGTGLTGTGLTGTELTGTGLTVRDLARRSQAAAGAKDREAWLGLFTPDAIVEDPIGPSPFDPQGTGHRGTAAIAAFYDTVIDRAEGLVFDIERSYLCGNEVADVGTIRTTLAGGTHIAIVRGVFTYRSDGAGKLVALRAFWEMGALELVEARA